MYQVHDFQQSPCGDSQEDMLFYNFNNYAHLAYMRF